MLRFSLTFHIGPSESLRDALCTRVGSSLSASLVRCAASSSSNCDLAWVCQLSEGLAVPLVTGLVGPLRGREVEQCLGCNSVLRCQIFSASTTRCHTSGDPCGRAVRGSPPSRVCACKRASSKQQRSRWVEGIITVAGRTAA